MKKPNLRVGPGIVLAGYTVFLVWYATLPRPEQPWMPHLDDKARHIGAFFVMTALALKTLDFPHFIPRNDDWKWFLAPVYAMAVGGLIEFLQIRVPGRTAEIPDLAANAVGAAAAVLAGLSLIRRQERLKRVANGAH